MSIRKRKEREKKKKRKIRYSHFRSTIVNWIHQNQRPCGWVNGVYGILWRVCVYACVCVRSFASVHKNDKTLFFMRSYELINKKAYDRMQTYAQPIVRTIIRCGTSGRPFKRRILIGANVAWETSACTRVCMCTRRKKQRPRIIDEMLTQNQNKAEFWTIKNKQYPGPHDAYKRSENKAAAL